MLKVGLTGGIGSGKSTVAAILQTLGVAVYYADDRAKFLMQHTLRDEICHIFGREAFDSNRLLNRAYIAQSVFSDSSLLCQLNSLVHPSVERDFEQWATEQHSAAYVVQEAAILVESGAYKKMDTIVVVLSPLELRVQRVCARDGLHAQDVLSRINSQMSELERESYANYTILADETELLTPQVLALHRKLLQIA
ncbi:MAG: dephospho-CoA kinase [Mucinivorans sp.]